ncbi:hypothetical protein HPB51_000024 [Rhipicephalus microplus]|uniref:Uncharacterized protein n=1 Tax=Rhipicephalus microplus TaxID=6941 RepID=A0A9J6E5P5_RHIMP|nr:hypothetical protein HPB51_000024 [Rhipicephalus microplus]
MAHLHLALECGNADGVIRGAISRVIGGMTSGVSTGSTMARILPSQREDFVVIWHLFGHHVGSKLLAGTPEEPVVSLLADERPEAVGWDDLTTRSCLATSPTDEPLRGRPGKELIPLSLATFDCRHLLDSIVWFASSLRRASTTSGKSGGTTLRDGTGPRARYFPSRRS